jgi:hypothetical protein
MLLSRYIAYRLFFVQFWSEFQFSKKKLKKILQNILETKIGL